MKGKMWMLTTPGFLLVFYCTHLLFLAVTASSETINQLVLKRQNIPVNKFCPEAVFVDRLCLALLGHKRPRLPRCLSLSGQ